MNDDDNDNDDNANPFLLTAGTRTAPTAGNIATHNGTSSNTTADEQQEEGLEVEEHPRPPVVSRITADMMQDDPNTIPLSEQLTGKDDEEDLDAMLANLGAYFSS
jgi:hypothetical protein